MIRSLARFVMYAVPVGCVLIPCSGLTAQQAINVANSSSTALITQSPDSTGSSAETHSPATSAFASLDAAASTGSLSGAAQPDGGPQTVQKNASAPQNTPDGQEGQQTKRILGIIPNFRAISANTKLPAQSVKEKFITASQDSFDYSSIFIPAMLSGYSMETKATPEFHQGAAGYARYFWHAAVDQTSENYMVEFVVPSITHEDTRYYTMGKGGFLKRTGYALSRTVVTRSDSGKKVFNASEIIGSGASSGLSSLYYPSRERSIGNTGKEWGIDVGVDGISFMVKEFWPDINRRLFHGAKPSADTQ
ncbi:MAG: hypothetical protein P4K94_02240 [Terracidiphilus sp.]|nr:hypothetical protein [Terracidiphilus sp.]